MTCTATTLAYGGKGAAALCPLPHTGINLVYVAMFSVACIFIGAFSLFGWRP